MAKIAINLSMHNSYINSSNVPSAIIIIPPITQNVLGRRSLEAEAVKPIRLPMATERTLSTPTASEALNGDNPVSPAPIATGMQFMARPLPKTMVSFPRKRNIPILFTVIFL